MKTYIFKNIETGEIKATIKTHSLVLAEEFFETTYYYVSDKYKTFEA